ncbi:MAG: acyloxyacyl hydrolase [Flavipsychrobacter sp.]
MKPYFLVLLLMFGGMHSSLAQTNKPWSGFGIEVNASMGKMIRHTPKFPKQLPNVVTNYELNFIQQTYGRKAWQQRRKFPVVGFAVGYTDYGIDSIYGKCISLYPNLQIPIIKSDKIEWTIRAGFGIAYMTKYFRRYPSFDTVNTAIGGALNNFTHFTTDLRYRINQNLDIQLGANFYHVSNASFKIPNLGINTYGAHVGFRYFPTTSTPENIERRLKPLKNRWLAQARLGYTTRQYTAADGPDYPIYMLTLYASKRYWSKNKLLLGADYTFHSEVYQFLKNNEIEVGKEKDNSWRASLFVGNEFLVGRVGIIFQLGYYIKNVYITEDSFYEKLGGNFYIVQKEQGVLKELFLSTLLKTHAEKAELVEVGLGFGF